MSETALQRVARLADRDELPDRDLAVALADEPDTAALAALAARIRDRGFGNGVTYSRKVFIPLTHLCRDVCHYCTFAQVPRKLKAPYLTVDEVLEIARHGAALGCKEALFTLGEKPELRYKAAREALAEMGFESTLDYLRHVAERVLKETGLLPHLNPGTMTADELAHLRPVSPSMGIMLESLSDRLCEKGMPHYGSPDKVPAVRLATLERAGEARIPFTTGILIGIGETRLERVESLLAIRDVHARHGHIQEIIVQNFRAKPDTRMAHAPEPDLDELLWTIAIARIVFGSRMSVQAPPNLSPGVLPQIVAAGIDDWGGVSPLTPDFVNPEAPWPHLDELARETEAAGKHLHERLTIYPRFVRELDTWVDPALHERILELVDAEGAARTDDWCPGAEVAPPAAVLDAITRPPRRVSEDLTRILDRAAAGEDLGEAELVRLFAARGDDFAAVVQAADRLRAQVNGDVVSYVVNRNINYTNICYFKCQFCAFSKGKLSENLRGRPYDLSDEEIQRRTREAWDRGATEVCMQGGIHPEYTGEKYVSILRAVKAAVPEMHVHAFSPLEVWQGAATSNLDLPTYLERLKEAGLGTLPGTAAEILDDEVRAIICPDKINTEQWLSVMEAAHRAGFRTTATIMYGHVERTEHWARHLLRIRELQKRTGGFTEFVPLPFIHMEAPMYLKGKARKGPTFREAVLMHAVARLALHPYITNIQASWVKMGHEGVKACLNAGCNDLGGTLMNESISRAAGTTHGQETSPQQMQEMIRAAGRTPRQRTTLYGDASPERIEAGLAAGELSEIVNTPARKYERKRGGPLLRPGLIQAVDVG
ncbi:MAG TPA: 5-amino-6-(D-ribitylamino)uracil--L-tyrosine 4-hydroxyphenyl transferase CofH [Pseudomonadales bacterium]